MVVLTCADCMYWQSDSPKKTGNLAPCTKWKVSFENKDSMFSLVRGQNAPKVRTHATFGCNLAKRRATCPLCGAEGNDLTEHSDRGNNTARCSRISCSVKRFYVKNLDSI